MSRNFTAKTEDEALVLAKGCYIPLPSLKIIREAFSLDEENGLLIWKTRPISHFRSEKMCKIFNAQFAGKVAGYTDKRGYVGLSMGGKKYWVHRIIYLMAQGCISEHQIIDHADGNQSNNRPANLRLATHSDNCANGRLRRTNSLGFKGVFKHGNKFAAQITKHGKTVCLGSFLTPQEAHLAYAYAAKDIHGEFARAE